MLNPEVHFFQLRNPYDLKSELIIFNGQFHPPASSGSDLGGLGQGPLPYPQDLYLVLGDHGLADTSQEGNKLDPQGSTSP